MVTILATVHVEEGWQGASEELARRVSTLRDHTPGLHIDRLLHDIDERRRYVILCEWEDREHFDAFERAWGRLWEHDGISETWIVTRIVSFLEDVPLTVDSATLERPI